MIYIKKLFTSECAQIAVIVDTVEIFFKFKATKGALDEDLIFTNKKDNADYKGHLIWKNVKQSTPFITGSIASSFIKDNYQDGYLMLFEDTTDSHRFNFELIEVTNPNYNFYCNLLKDFSQDRKKAHLIINFDSANVAEISNSRIPLQQIFYGAPGTGKSHEIKEKTKGQSVIRTTFHPDSDYSTFVGCYKPTMSDPKPIYGFDATGKTVKVEDPKGEIIGEQKIEYKFVKQAFLKAYLGAWKKMANYKPIDRVFSVSGTKYDIIGISDDLVRVKLSDSDDSTEIEIKKSELEKICKTKDSHDEEGQMPQELGSDKPNEEQKNPNNQGDVNKIKEGLGERLKEIDNSFDIAWSTLEKGFLDPQFLIIEEINRGNCAQIFGDVFQLLDRGGNRFSEYPIEADTDLQKEIENAFKNEKEYKLDCDINVDGVVKDYVSNYENGTLSKDIQAGRILLLPPNLYIWATMNTSDQSLFPIDSAFKRRWDWTYIPIKKSEKDNYKIEVKGVLYDWWSFIDQMNKVVEKATESEDKKMGYYFCKPDKKESVISTKKFVNKVLFYLYNDVFKDNGLDWDLDGQPVFKYTEDKDKEVVLTFAKYFNPDGSPIENQVERLMKNLKVEEYIDFDGASLGFKLDGNDMSLRDIAKQVVLNYAKNNPSKSSQEIKDYFVDLCKDIRVAHIVETETEYHSRDGQASQERSASEITIPSGEKLYVSTQWRAKKDDDNFIQFLKIVNDNALGTISK